MYKYKIQEKISLFQVRMKNIKWLICKEYHGKGSVVLNVSMAVVRLELVVDSFSITEARVYIKVLVLMSSFL